MKETASALVVLKVVDIADYAPDLKWLAGLEFHWPRVFFETLTQGEGKVFGKAQVGGATYPLREAESFSLDVDELLRAQVGSVLFTSRPLSAKLPISYNRIPHQCRWAAASAVVRLAKLWRRGRDEFPSWPLDLSIDSITHLIQKFRRVTAESVPCVLLTHDIDNPDSCGELPFFIEIEEKLKVRSTNFIVPRLWKLDYGFLDSLSQKGHEVGIHGYNHGNRTPFMTPERIAARMDELSDLIGRYRIKGYRSASLLRTEALFGVLSRYFDYDASVPNVHGYYSLRSNGCGTAKPFYYGSLLEIPVTLPSDASLLFQGMKPMEILELWKTLSGVIVRSGGIVHLLTHCEERYSGNPAMLQVYREFIMHLQSFEKCPFLTLTEASERFHQKKNSVPRLNS